jgi:uncharacterized protein YndB with AHSA1/START domain
MISAKTRVTPGYTVDRESFIIRFERLVDADPAEVFDAWTQPEQVTEWWDPDGERLVACSIDLRVGGSFSFVTRQHAQMPFIGVYREIAPPHLLVFEAMGATGRVLLDQAPGGTRMLVEIVCRSKEQFEQLSKMGVAEGTSRTLDNLVAYVGRGK